jgi:hypothetical protein
VSIRLAGGPGIEGSVLGSETLESCRVVDVFENKRVNVQSRIRRRVADCNWSPVPRFVEDPIEVQSG